MLPAAEGLRRAGLAPLEAARQGRPRADQRHAGLDRAGPGRPVRRRRPVRRGGGRRRHVGRRAERQRRAVRCAHSPVARPAGPDRRGARIPRADGGQRDPRLAPRLHRVQDPYSFRCQPQVMGACLDLIRQCGAHARDRGERRHRQPAGVRRRKARCSRAAISTPSRWPSPPTRWRWRSPRSATCRSGASAVLIDPKMSGLPPFLVENSGLNSGLHDRAGHRRRAGLGEQDARRPRSVDSIPTSANQEDHVSMATHAARRLRVMATMRRPSSASSCWRRRRASIFTALPAPRPRLEQVHARYPQRGRLLCGRPLFRAGHRGGQALGQVGALRAVGQTNACFARLNR